MLLFCPPMVPKPELFEVFPERLKKVELVALVTSASNWKVRWRVAVSRTLKVRRSPRSISHHPGPWMPSGAERATLPNFQVAEGEFVFPQEAVVFSREESGHWKACALR